MNRKMEQYLPIIEKLKSRKFLSEWIMKYEITKKKELRKHNYIQWISYSILGISVFSLAYFLCYQFKIDLLLAVPMSCALSLLGIGLTHDMSQSNNSILNKLHLNQFNENEKLQSLKNNLHESFKSDKSLIEDLSSIRVDDLSEDSFDLIIQSIVVKDSAEETYKAFHSLLESNLLFENKKIIILQEQERKANQDSEKERIYKYLHSLDIKKIDNPDREERKKRKEELTEHYIKSEKYFKLKQIEKERSELKFSIKKNQTYDKATINETKGKILKLL